MHVTKLLKSLSLLLAMGVADMSTAGPVTGFDVVEDPTRRAGPGSHAPGAREVTQGYIYPKGTLAGGQSGVLADGRPAFPAKVLGHWSRESRMLGAPGAGDGIGQVISHQVFAFHTGDVIVTEGVDSAEVGNAHPRAITGATGVFRIRGAAMQQVVLGRGESGAMRARFHFGTGAQNGKGDGFDAD